MVELENVEHFPCPQELETFAGSDSECSLSYLPMFSPVTRDVLTQVVYIGKAVMKEAYLKQRDTKYLLMGGA